MSLVLSALCGYLLGSIPFGLLLAKVCGYGDIRAIGSGNIGATNVLRTGNKKLALAVLVLDGAKGAAAVLLALFLLTYDAALVAAAGAFIGHLFPVWLRFRGGKGVATALGILLALAPPLGLAACAIWLCVFAAFRISSLAALCALGICPLLAFAFFRAPSRIEGADGSLTLLMNHHTAMLPLLCAFFAALVFYRHRANIGRLIKGEEPRVGAAKG